MKYRMRIRELRKGLGLTQQALGDLMGVSKPVICKWESGQRKPSVDKLPLLATSLHCTIDGLYDQSFAQAREAAS